MKWPRLGEIEDQPWLPKVLRDQVTDALHHLIVEMQIYAPIIPEFLWLMQQSPTKRVVDLCSGGGGPWEYLLGGITNLEESVERITLTDLYPNQKALQALSASHPLVTYQAESVNALNIATELVGVRTLFSCLHHFDTAESTAIIQDAVNQQMPIGIFEFSERRPANFLLTPIYILFLFTNLLFKQPVTLSRVLFSYLVPIVPLIFLWDSCVSHLRSYSPTELQAILKQVNNSEAYVWEIGVSSSPKTPLKNTYLIGYPRKA